LRLAKDNAVLFAPLQSNWPTTRSRPYLDVQTGKVHSITEEEFDLAEDPQTAIEDLPDWQRETVELARNIQQHEGKRYLALPDKFDVHEWAIMDSFSESLRDPRLRNDFHGAIRGPCTLVQFPT
jgi:hypothetical protein